jgi:hypothetical protein
MPNQLISKTHSTQSSLHTIVSDILDVINTNNFNILYLLDLAKCCANIDDGIVLCKLEKYDLRGKIIKFLK